MMLALFFVFGFALGSAWNQTALTHSTWNKSTNSWTGYRNVAYYNKDWISKSFYPQDLPETLLTHVVYAYASVNKTGEVSLTNMWEDAQAPWPGDTPVNTSLNLYGCLKQFYLLKKRNRRLKVLLGIGGPERGLTLTAAAATPANRMLFGLTVSRLLLDYGLDGISIDWLDQNDTTEAHNFVLLLLETRKWLNIAQQTRTGNFTLAVASPGRPSSYALLYINQMDRYIDFWNLHTFGYKDPRSRVAAHQANIYSETKDSELDSTPYSSKAMVDYFVAQGVDKRKVVLSMPLVGFLYPNTSGPGSVYSRVNAVGYVDYVELPPTNATEYVDDRLLVSYSYDVFKRHFISYDNPAVAVMKARWIRNHSLGGGSWWESRADAPGNRSLIQAFAKTINVSNLDSSQNMLAYPDSPYVNLRGGMPEY